jgi:hypothetical protein
MPDSSIHRDGHSEHDHANGADGRGRAGNVLALLGAIGAGAAIMYFLDPDRGAARRAVARDRLTSTLHDAEQRLDASRRHVANRARGLLAETRAKLTPEDVDDEVLVGRVRAELGRESSHPGAIEVASERCVITLSGPVLADEVDRVLQVTRKVRGVREVVSQLEVHEAAGSVPGLQGGGEASAAR